ncbi:MAG: 2Fe-2S iron-sulfur cluster binding domain-containing protein [Sandaracinaceae bacterium]|nr:2Fe-2S iron-sulfur cluster binding domain-containing protein [Sandaracinaceae bacterium]
MPTITFRDARYPTLPDESVLEALLRGGADVAFSCRRGSCQTCLLRATEGDPGEHARRGLRPELIHSGHFMPCVAKPVGDLIVDEPDLSQLLVKAQVARKQQLGPRVVRLSLETELTLDVRPGQYVNLRRDDGLTRSYSVRGLPDEDYFIEVDVQLMPGGAMSTWIHETLAEGDWLSLQGPVGDCHYRSEHAGRPLLLIGTGTGIAPLHGIARDALRKHHVGPIHVFYGGRVRDDLYAHEELLGLRASGVHYHAVLLRHEGATPGEDIAQGDVIEQAFAHVPDASEAVVLLCGDPALVQRARCEAVLRGAARSRILADPFESSVPRAPGDQAVLDSLAAEPELWEAVGRGALLRVILEDFYSAVYEDPRLGPFFHSVTKERAVSKQYEFLVDLFTGSRKFFGLKPFNAHHAMVISDELFDYREALFDTFLVKHGIPEPLRRRWAYIHECFRRDIVKSRTRGIFMDGVEVVHEGFSEEILSVANLCDGCESEMLVGSRGRLHRRTGQLYCDACHAAG